MYRRDLQRKMEEEQFLNRISSLPMVNSAVCQVTDIYFKTKEHNSLFRFTLGTAESGVKSVASHAQPIVTKFDGPVNMLNSYACHQLNNLEGKFPLITKPTEEVTSTVYENTLKPAVDQLSAVTRYGIDKAYNVKNYGMDKANNVKDFSVNQVNSVTEYGKGKANSMLSSESGQKLTTSAISTVNTVLDVTERYLDYYLPEEEDTEEKEENEIKKPVSSDTLTRAMNVGGKVKGRLHRHAMRKLGDVQKRSKETIEKLNFTVDLIQYAKENMNAATDRVSGGMVQCRDKACYIWDEINKSEDEVMQDEITKETTQQSFESRMIATARHLTLKLKRGINSLPEISILPGGLHTQVLQLRNYANDLYTSFDKATGFEDISSHLINETRERLHSVQETLGSLTDYALTLTPLSWVAGKRLTIEEKESKEEEIEMESPVRGND